MFIIEFIGDQQMATKRSRIYVGCANGTREVFSSKEIPTRKTHSQFGAIIGPFRTHAGAQFMAECGYGNTHCVTVADAERLAKIYNKD